MAPKAEGTCREAALPNWLGPEEVFSIGKGWGVLFGVLEGSGGASNGTAAELCPAAVLEVERIADSCKSEEGCWLAGDASVPEDEGPIPKGLLAGTEPISEGANLKPATPNPCWLGWADPKPDNPDPCLLAGTEPKPKAAEPVPDEADAEAAAALAPNVLVGADPNSGSA